MDERTPHSSDFSQYLVGDDHLSSQSSNLSPFEHNTGGETVLGYKLPGNIGRIRGPGELVSSALGTPSKSIVARYFRDVARYPAIGIDAELRYAQTLEQAEIAHWVALFSYTPVAKLLLTDLRRDIVDLSKRERPDLLQIDELERLCCCYREQQLKLNTTQQNEWNRLTIELARAIRLVDADRNWVTHAREIACAWVKTDCASNVTTSASSERWHYIRRVRRTELRVRETRNAFATAYLRLVLSVAFRYDRGRVPLVDLIQEGNLGLLKALNRFDHSRGYRFSTYALWWIRYFISCALDDKGRMIRIPTHALRTHRRIERARSALYALSGHAPALDELEQASGVPRDQIIAVQQVVTEVSLSLDRPLGHEGSSHVVDVLIDEHCASPVDQLAHNAWAREVERVLETLTPMESNIIRWRFGLDDGDELTLQDIGNRYHLSRERIRQLQERAMDKIRGEVKQSWCVDSKR